MNHKSLAATIFDLQVAIENCERSGNSEWLAKHRASMRALAKLLPSGSGIDSGTEIAAVNTKIDRILLTCSFHHMDEHGGYDGWTDHKITVAPSFDGIHVRVTGGNNRNDINEYLHDVFDGHLAGLVHHDADTGRWLDDYQWAHRNDACNCRERSDSDSESHDDNCERGS